MLRPEEMLKVVREVFLCDLLAHACVEHGPLGSWGSRCCPNRAAWPSTMLVASIGLLPAKNHIILCAWQVVGANRKCFWPALLLRARDAELLWAGPCFRCGGFSCGRVLLFSTDSASSAKSTTA